MKIQVDDKGTVELGTVSNWSAEKRHIVSRHLAYWLVTPKQAPSFVRDIAFHEFCQEISSRRFNSYSAQEISKQVCDITVTSVM
mgnify:CR=1 FL=1